MRKANLFLAFLILLVGNNYNAFSQKESNIWYFGRNAGITFSTIPPSALTNGMLATGEGCATICDKKGKLLFYTDGLTVWNKNDSVMDNGTGLNGNFSSTQSATIVPKPGSNKIYYVFTADAWVNNGFNGLQYSEVDISMNGGLGKIINKNIELIKPSSEKVTVAKHGNKIDYWVITHGINNNNFYCYLVSSNGINATPVISSVGAVKDITKGQGSLKASNNSKKLVSANYSEELELFDFDNLNGIVINALQIGNKEKFYGVEFSPDNSKLYVSVTVPADIYQYDLLSADIANSKKIIYNGSNKLAGALQIGNDRKIYFSEVYSEYLGVINNPDDDICNYVKNAIYLGGKICETGLPNIVPSLIITDSPIAHFIASDTIICQGEKVDFINTTYKQTTRQKWLNNGIPFDTNRNTNYTFNNAGNYTISLIVNKDTLFDTASIVIYVSQTKLTILYPEICQGDTFTTGTHNYTTTGIYYDTLITYLGCDSIITTNLNVSPVEQTTVYPIICLGDAFTVGTNNYTTSGTYYDTLKTYSGCDSIITTNLHVNHPKTNFLPPDTAICFDNGEQLQLDGGIANSYLWYPSLITDRYQNVISEGTYKLVIKDSLGCESTDSISVDNVCKMTLFMPNAFAPNGVNIVFKAYGESIKQIELKIYNRWGELVYEGSGDYSTFWNGKYHNELCQEGAYYYWVKASGSNSETKELYGLIHLIR